MTPISRHIGVLGAGQLGRMLAISGYPLGQKFGFLGAGPGDPSALLGHMHGAVDDARSVEALLRFADVITYESENTDVELVRRLAREVPVYPGAASLYHAQHRGREKGLFDRLGIPCAPYRRVAERAALDGAVAELGLPAVLKTATEGYDGKGQYLVREPGELDAAWAAMAGREAVLEGFVAFRRELSIIAVRNAADEHVYYPLVENRHHDGILRTTIAPAPAVEPAVQQKAEGYMRALLDEMDHVGCLALELFETEDGLLANEMAPRVHNSGHWSIEGAQTSQFENHVRAITGLPLGETTPRQPWAAMVNIIGETGPVEEVLRMPGCHLHLYDKAERPGRKLGHVNVLADTREALDAALARLAPFLP